MEKVKYQMRKMTSLILIKIYHVQQQLALWKIQDALKLIIK